LLPPDLKIKENTKVIHICSLDISDGVCNGTSLTVTELCYNVITVTVITGRKSGKEVQITLVTLDSSSSWSTGQRINLDYNGTKLISLATYISDDRA
jgi:hypothetical protein